MGLGIFVYVLIKLYWIDTCVPFCFVDADAFYSDTHSLTFETWKFAFAVVTPTDRPTVFAPRRSKYSKAKQDSDEEKHLHQGNS